MNNVVRKMNQMMILFFVISGVYFGGILCDNVIIAHAETTVYVTPTGSKYHTHACGRGSFSKTTLSTAKSMGLSPCSKCFGGSNGRSNESGSSHSEKKKTTVKPIKPIKINKKCLLLVKGQTAKLTIKNATTKIKWKSSKKSVVSVSSRGKVKGKKKGKAVVTATVGKMRRTCKITVETPKLNTSAATMNIGDTKILKLSGCKHSIKWSSNDTEVAQVQKGKVIAKDAGTATIIAKTHGGKYTCKLKVNKPLLTNISLSESALKLGYNEERILSVTGTPKGVLSYYRISVRSSDESIVRASVDNDEKTVLLEVQQKTGKASVYVSVGNITRECQIDVVPSVITELTIPKRLNLKPDGERMITYTVTPYDASDYYDVEWKSADENIATVKEFGNGSVAVTAVGEGETDVTVTIGDKTATCHVVVAKPEITSLTTMENLNLKPDGERMITYTVTPYDASDYYDVEWKSADENIATVKESGSSRATVTAVGEGETDVAVTIGDKTATCHVVVAE